LSWNCGVEGPSDDPKINDLRDRQKRNFLATLFLSQGVPMLKAGDEIGRTQQGNNNAYCQDNTLSWLNWDLKSENEELLNFVQELISLRKAHPVFRRRRFFQGRLIKGGTIRDIVWLTPDGQEMTDEEWNHSQAGCLGIFLAGDAMVEKDEKGSPIVDDKFLLLVNAHAEPISFAIPSIARVKSWRLLIDTSLAAETNETKHGYSFGEAYPLQEHSLVLLIGAPVRRTNETESETSP